MLFSKYSKIFLELQPVKSMTSFWQEPQKPPSSVFLKPLNFSEHGLLISRVNLLFII
ncbi:hypothetical protein T190611E02C_20086 [Tenacibaculum sp. 190524A05c]